MSGEGATARHALGVRLDRYAASGGDLTAVEDEAHRPLRLDDRRLVLLGAGSRIAQPFVAYALARFRIAAVVDNQRIGQRLGGLTVHGDGVVEALAREPGHLAVVCAFGAAQHHFLDLAHRCGMPCLTLAQALRRAGMLAPDEPSDWLRNAHPEVTRDVLDRVERAGWFDHDPASRDTLHAVLLHRLSWNPRHLDAVRRPDRAFCAEPGPVRPGPGAVIVDAGAFDGDTAAHFRDLTAGAYGALHCFEPDTYNCAALRARVAGWPDTVVHEAGLWSSSGRIAFEAEGTQGSRVDGHGATSIAVVALDDLPGLRPTLVKMDIEGAEADALAGMRDTLRVHRPRLALSAYHRPEDLFRLPELIHGIRDDYRFHLAHYGAGLFDTVLYAV